MPFSFLNCLQAWRRSLNPPARAGVPHVLVINPEKCLQGREKETSVAENEPNQIPMIAPLAIYGNEDVNEGAPGGLCQPLAPFLLTKVWQGQWYRFFILVAWSPLTCSICCNKPKTNLSWRPYCWAGLLPSGVRFLPRKWGGNDRFS